MQAFREFKAIWDPGAQANPRIIVDPYRADEHLRRGPDYQPLGPVTDILFANNQGSFTRAVEHCIGMGKCRAGRHHVPELPRDRGGALLTRGRSRLLCEMLRGKVIPDGWQSEEVKEALDCAWPARAAGATARRTSTWRPTRRSSCRIITRVGFGL